MLMMYLLWFMVYSCIFISTVWSKKEDCVPNKDCMLSCSEEKLIFIYKACYCQDEANCQCDDCERVYGEEYSNDGCPISQMRFNDVDLELFKDCALQQSCNATMTSSISTASFRISYVCESKNHMLFTSIGLGEYIHNGRTLFYHDGEVKTAPINIDCKISPETDKMKIFLNLVKIPKASRTRIIIMSNKLNHNYTSGTFVYRKIYEHINDTINLLLVLYPDNDIISIGVTRKTFVTCNITTIVTTASTQTTPTRLIPTPSTPTTYISTTSTEMSNNQPVNSPSTVGSTVGWTVGVIVVVVIVVVCIVIVIIVRKKRICNSSKSNVGGITDRINMGNETSHDYEAPDEHYYMELNANVENTLTACSPPSGSVQEKTTEDDYNHIGNQDKSTNGYSAMLNNHQNDYNHINLTNNSNSDNMPPESDVYKHLNQFKNDNSAMNNLNEDYDHLPVTLEDNYQTLGQDMKDPKHDPNYDHFPELKSGIYNHL